MQNVSRKEFLALAFAAIAAPAQTPSDPWTTNELISPKELADRLAAKTNVPPLLFVGFPVLYRSTHLPGALLAGPCAKPEGLEELKKAAKNLQRSREVLLYCGCCPFVKCPNVRPAYTALRGMDFSRIRILNLETNLHTDWVVKGYPVEKAAA